MTITIGQGRLVEAAGAAGPGAAGRGIVAAVQHHLAAGRLGARLEGLQEDLGVARTRELPGFGVAPTHADARRDAERIPVLLAHRSAERRDGKKWARRGNSRGL